MSAKVTRLLNIPEPTTFSPLSQMEWVFFQLDSERPNCHYVYACNKYKKFLQDTHPYEEKLQHDPRFFLHKYWREDALIKFTEWLKREPLTSKTKYSIYKSVRSAMDWSYALGLIDYPIYHPPMFKGVSETSERASYSESEQETIDAAIARWINLALKVSCGYEPTGGGIPFMRRVSKDTIDIGTETIPINIASERFCLSKQIIFSRIRSGFTDREAVGLEERPYSSAPKGITVEGHYFPSLSRAAQHYKTNRRSISVALDRGFSPEQAVGLLPKLASRHSEEALLWEFENVFMCDARAFFHHHGGRGTKPSNRVSQKLLMILFKRWGVWPYVDRRLIFPIAFELARITGLNAESISSLTLDSYQRNHPLTNQPCITYWKERSASSTRSPERELSLAELEVRNKALEANDLYLDSLDQGVIERVDALINLTISLTSKIRPYASPDIANRLFLYEEEGWNKLLPSEVEVKSIHWLKGASWYRIFEREEGLKQILGDQFSLNISRCRPTLATNMVLAGADIFQVQSVLGQSSVMVTANYLDSLQLNPKFNQEMSKALKAISQRSKLEVTANSQAPSKPITQDAVIQIEPIGFAETLSGCGCKNAYNPSQKVREETNYQDGSVCKYWNMCLLCENSIITQQSLPKLIAYQDKVKEALSRGGVTMEGRRRLYEDVVSMINGILEPDAIFPESIVSDARKLARNIDDELIDQLVYQGI